MHNNTPPYVIAEIGCNHCGNFQTAKEMIQVAHATCKANAVKFQKRTISECLSQEEASAPHPVPYNSYGQTYGQHREKLEFDLNQHKELKQYCDQLGIEYLCSVWDLTSAKEIASLNPTSIKLPSACNSNPELLEFLCQNFPGTLHISLGMTGHQEESEIVNTLSNFNRLQHTVLYACTSGYPVDDKDVCLLEIQRLKQNYIDKVKAIGFSGHHQGIAIDMGALTLGAQYFERHFTLDRTWKGTDHAASLEPDGLRRLVRDLESVSNALTYKSQEILPVESPQRDKLKWNRNLQVS